MPTFIDDSVVAAMALTLAQSSVDLGDDAETALLLLEAGYDENQIATHRPFAVLAAGIKQTVDGICAGLPLDLDELRAAATAGGAHHV